MNAVDREVSLKIVVCAAIALALTAVSSWSFVESTSTVRGQEVVAEQEFGDLGEIQIIGSRTVAQN